MKRGLCLSGGAALGFTHIGAIKAIEEAHMHIDAVSGASMGAIIGALYCQGYSSNEMIDIVEENKLFNLLNIVKRSKISLPGFSSHDKIEEVLTSLIPHNNFQSLKKEFHVSVTDIAEPDWHIISEGELINIVLASISIPVVFEPECIGNRVYVDGGVMNNLPVEPLCNSCDHIIGVDVQDISPITQALTTKSMTMRYYGAMMKQMQKHRTKMCNTYINFPELKSYDLYSFSKYKEMIDIGYRRTKEIIK